MRFYDALGLEAKLALDSEDLKKRFYERSREWHPDKFSRRPAEQQKEALEMTAVLNDAFRTLRDPISRAEYFLEENGLKPTKAPPPELLEEAFELNMALEELRGGDASVRPQLAEARDRFLEMQQKIDQTLAALFTKFDASKEAVWAAAVHENGGWYSPEILPEIRATLDRRRYVSNLLRDVGKALQ